MKNSHKKTMLCEWENLTLESIDCYIFNDLQNQYNIQIAYFSFSRAPNKISKISGLSTLYKYFTKSFYFIPKNLILPNCTWFKHQEPQNY